MISRLDEDASQATLALELGYADQAHFVKDFKAAVGTPPAAVRAQPYRACGARNARIVAVTVSVLESNT